MLPPGGWWPKSREVDRSSITAHPSITFQSAGFGLELNFRKKNSGSVADHTGAIRAIHLKIGLLFQIVQPLAIRSYFPAGAFRCNSSAKFSRKITWCCDCCPSAPSAGIRAAMRLPSGATS